MSSIPPSPGESCPDLDSARQQLRSAIWNSDAALVAVTLEKEPAILNEPMDHPRWGGRPAPIQLAAERGATDVIDTLLREGADPNAGQDSYGGWTALHLTAHWGHYEAAELLIERGARVDIFAACLLDDGPLVASMVAEDPDSAARSGLGGGTSPLHLAMSPEVASILLDHGASLASTDEEGNTPLGAAIGRGDRCRGLAGFLIDRGAEADPCQLAALGRTDQLQQRHLADAGIIDFVGKIGVHAVVGKPLHAAVQHGQAETVREMLDWGANVNARADSGQTPLHLCDNPHIARMLVEAGADPGAVDDEHRTTPLVWANVGIEIHGPTPDRTALVSYLESITPAPED